VGVSDKEWFEGDMRSLCDDCYLNPQNNEGSTERLERIVSKGYFRRIIPCDGKPEIQSVVVGKENIVTVICPKNVEFKRK